MIAKRQRFDSASWPVAPTPHACERAVLRLGCSHTHEAAVLIEREVRAAIRAGRRAKTLPRGFDGNPFVYVPTVRDDDPRATQQPRQLRRRKVTGGDHRRYVWTEDGGRAYVVRRKTLNGAPRWVVLTVLVRGMARIEGVEVAL